jgi:hypothetical protein
MPDSNDTTPLKLDPISLQIIRQQLLHVVGRLSDEDLEDAEGAEGAEEIVDDATNGD